MNNDLQSTQVYWSLHETFTNREQAKAMAKFCVEQVGYRGARVQLEEGEMLNVYYLFVLKFN